MEFRRGRFSWLIRPALTIYDIIIINVFAYYLLDFGDAEIYFITDPFFKNKHLIYFIYSSCFWLLSTFFVRFYKVYRYTSLFNILSLVIKQFFVYTIIIYGFIGVFRSIDLSAFTTLRYLVICFIAIGFGKILSYYILKAT